MWLLVLSLSLLLLLLLNYFIVIDNRFGYLLGLLSFRWRWQFGNSDTFFASFTLRLGGVFFLFVFSYFLFFLFGVSKLCFSFSFVFLCFFSTVTVIWGYIAQQQISFMFLFFLLFYALVVVLLSSASVSSSCVLS